MTDRPERRERGAARDASHVERELIGQGHDRPFVAEIPERAHRREPDVEVLVVDPPDERHSGGLHPKVTERSRRRDSHRRLTVAQGGHDLERDGIGDRRGQDDPQRRTRRRGGPSGASSASAFTSATDSSAGAGQTCARNRATSNASAALSVDRLRAGCT